MPRAWREEFDGLEPIGNSATLSSQRAPLPDRPLFLFVLSFFSVLHFNSFLFIL